MVSPLAAHTRYDADLLSIADSYAWALGFNYFNDKWGWKSDGNFTFPHDDTKRGIEKKCDTKNSTTVALDFEQNPDSVLDASKIDDKKYP